LLPGPPLEGLRRVVVITSAETASASELLINALRPFMPVVLVGQTTYGKPYGFQPRTECGTSFNPVAFETLNALGEGRFVDGFAPWCEAADSLGLHQQVLGPRCRRPGSRS
jgi:carboxyl-terminal processing protease